VLAALVPTLLNAVVGIIAGALTLPVVLTLQRLLPSNAPAK
jgi:predicted DNA repair protein MutK